jgi:hypothetical protein
MGNSYSQVNYDKPHKNEKYIGNGIAFMDKTPVKHGHGIYHKDGDVYTGNFKYNKRHGQGTIEFSNGNSYSGAWINDHMHGFGTFNTSLGMYTGQIQYGLMHGTGTYYYDSGYVYKGRFIMGKRSGTGILYKIINLNPETNTDRDKMNKVIVYKGKWYDNKKNGKGTLYYKNGNKFIENGFFVHGIINNPDRGTTKIYNSNGDVFTSTIKFKDGDIDQTSISLIPEHEKNYLRNLVHNYATEFYDKCFKLNIHSAPIPIAPVAIAPESAPAPPPAPIPIAPEPSAPPLPPPSYGIADNYNGNDNSELPPPEA